MYFVDAPSVRKLGVDVHWRYFAYMFEKAGAFQVTYTAVAVIASIVYGIRITDSKFDRNLWLFAGSVFVSTVPYTLNYHETNN